MSGFDFRQAQGAGGGDGATKSDRSGRNRINGRGARRDQALDHVVDAPPPFLRSVALEAGGSDEVLEGLAFPVRQAPELHRLKDDAFASGSYARFTLPRTLTNVGCR